MKKLVLSILTVILSAVAVGTAGFAWFTLTNTATVQAFEGQIISDEGIEISLDGINWYTTLTTAVIENHIFNSDFQEFRAVTSPNGTQIRNNNEAQSVASATDYIQFTLHFRSSSATAISWTSVALTSEGVPFTSNVDFTDGHGNEIEAGQQFTAYGANGIRVSFAAGANVVVYERGDGSEAPGTNKALGGLAAADLSNGGEGANGSVNYYKETADELPLNADEVTVPDTITTLGSGVNILSLALVDYDNPPADIELNSHTHYGTVIVRIWLEGWDPDTYNAVLADKVQVSFVFEGLE